MVASDAYGCSVSIDATPGQGLAPTPLPISVQETQGGSSSQMGKGEVRCALSGSFL